MPITNQLKAPIDRKAWEWLSVLPANKVAGSCFIRDQALANSQGMVILGVNLAYLYDFNTDSYMLLPVTGNGGTFAAGTCGCYHPLGPTGTAQTGSGASTLVTTLTIPADLTGYQVFITGGTGAGQTATILTNTHGANSTITFSAALGVALDTSSTYVLRTGRYYLFSSYAAAAVSDLRSYDVATNTWATVLTATTNLPGTWGTDGQLVATPGVYGQMGPFTATSGSTTTASVSTATWATGQWVNWQVRFLSGNLAGKSLPITASAGTSITFATQGSAPANGDLFYIEGNDNNLYLFGNNATASYLISISAGTVSTLTARTAALGAGGIAAWVSNVPDTRWQAVNYSSTLGYQNSRFIYTFTGGAANTIYAYDIVANSWGLITPWGWNETLTTGSCGNYDNGQYIYIFKDNLGRYFRYNLSTNAIQPWTVNVYPEGTNSVGQHICLHRYTDGNTSLTWLYKAVQNSLVMMRMMDI